MENTAGLGASAPNDELNIEMAYRQLLEEFQQDPKKKKRQPFANPNYVTSSQVFERLMLRHAILSKIVEIEREYAASKTYVRKIRNLQFEDHGKGPSDPAVRPEAVELGPYSPSTFPEYTVDKDSEREIRTYRLATTDLFVEKAIAYLEDDYSKYIRKGNWLFGFAITAIILGVIASGWILLFTHTVSTMTWPQVLETFIKGFTAYGFVVLFAVHCSRLGKAMMDQAERLRERRHSLRQGRLYVHLSNGEVTVDDLEKAFDWNVSKGNAFGNIPTESLAPWGSVFKEALKAVPEIFKKARNAAKG